MNDTSDLIPENETNWQNDWQIPYFDNLTEEQQKEITDSIRLLLRQTFVLERKYDKRQSGFSIRQLTAPSVNIFLLSAIIWLLPGSS